MTLPEKSMDEAAAKPVSDGGRVLGTVTELLDVASAAPPLTRVLPDVAVALAVASAMARATVLLFDHQGALSAGTTRTVAGHLDAQLWAAFRFLHESIPAIDAARRGGPIVIYADPESAADLGPSDWVARFEARTVVVAPLASVNRVLGVVVLDDPRRGAASPELRDALDSALRGAAAVLELLEAIESERTARARTEQVIETAAATARSMSVSAALGAMTEGVHQLTGDGVVVAATTGGDDRQAWVGDPGQAKELIESFLATGTIVGLGEAEALDLDAQRWLPIRELGYTRALAIPLRHRSRDLGWVLAAGREARPYRDADRRAAAVVADQASLALHTTSLLEAERAAVDRLTELDQLKSTFVAAVSHELRTPLTAILGYAELLAEEIEDPGLASHLEDLRRESAVLESLIGNLLDTSRLEAGLLRLNVHPIELDTILQSSIEVVGHGQRGRDIRLHVGDTSGPVAGDGARLRQVFINLIENAAKYSPDTTSVDVTLGKRFFDQGQEWITITIDDEGPGIPDDERARVFERFRRLANEDGIPGTGIGLYVVKALVEAHAGQIHIEDGPQGWGTRMVVTLPVTQPTGVA